MTTGRSVATFVLSVFLLVAAVGPTSAAEPDAGSGRTKPKITISKETTFLTEPLRADGMVDYAAALNRQASKGVTPENNAAVLFWQAVGPKSIKKPLRKAYFDRLGIAMPPEEGNYLVPLYDVLRESSDNTKWRWSVLDQLDELGRRPWSKEESPVVAALLTRNAKALETIIEATKRPRFYSPLVTEDGSDSLFRCTRIIGMSETREAIRELLALAMLQLGKGDGSAAWRTILAAERTASLYAQGPFLVDRLVSYTSAGNAYAAVVAFSQHQSLTTTQAKECQSQLRAQPSIAPLAEAINNGERLSSLEGTLDVAINGQKAALLKIDESLASFLPEKEKRRIEILRVLVSEKDIDWNEVLRLENRWFDRLIAAAREPKGSKQLELIDAIENEEAKALARTWDQLENARPSSIHDATPQTKIQWTATLRLGPGAFGPVCRAAVVNEERIKTNRDLALLALALSAYRHDHQKYPATLGELTPGYIDAIPKDRSTDGDLRYRTEKDGYLLYSVGGNGRDEGGANFSVDHGYLTAAEYEKASEAEKATDDIAIRTPVKKDSDR